MFGFNWLPYNLLFFSWLTLKELITDHTNTIQISGCDVKSHETFQTFKKSSFHPYDSSSHFDNGLANCNQCATSPIAAHFIPNLQLNRILSRHYWTGLYMGRYILTHNLSLLVEEILNTCDVCRPVTQLHTNILRNSNIIWRNVTTTTTINRKKHLHNTFI